MILELAENVKIVMDRYKVQQFVLEILKHLLLEE